MRVFFFLNIISEVLIVRLFPTQGQRVHLHGPMEVQENVSTLFKPLLGPSHAVHSQAPWNFPIRKEKLFREPGSVTTHDLNYTQVFENTEGSSIIKSIKQSSQPKKAVEEKKNRVWAVLWEINSTAFHQVEILALDTHKNEPA